MQPLYQKKIMQPLKKCLKKFNLSNLIYIFLDKSRNFSTNHCEYRKKLPWTHILVVNVSICFYWKMSQQSGEEKKLWQKKLHFFFFSKLFFFTIFLDTKCLWHFLVKHKLTHWKPRYVCRASFCNARQVFKNL